MCVVLFLANFQEFGLGGNVCVCGFVFSKLPSESTCNVSDT